MSSNEALDIASEKKLDLVLVAPNGNPPVCKIMNYGKYKFEQAKKEKEAKKKQKVSEVKEIRITPNIDVGDHVIVLNCDQVILTGNKLNQKMYRHHSGYIGGMKEVSAKDMMANSPEKAMMLAIKGMLPHTKLGAAQLKKLRVYAGSEHENAAQKPEAWNF